VCQGCDKPAKVRVKRLEDGEKVRVCRKCNQAVTVEA
jgi:hypothetical protein